MGDRRSEGAEDHDEERRLEEQLHPFGRRPAPPVDEEGVGRGEREHREVAREQARLERVLHPVGVRLRARVARPRGADDERDRDAKRAAQGAVRPRVRERIDERQHELRGERKGEDAELPEPDGKLPHGRVPRKAPGDVGDTQRELARQDVALLPKDGGARQHPFAGAAPALEGARTDVEAQQEQELEAEQRARKPGAPEHQRRRRERHRRQD